jgi:hypothetical protein
MGRNQHSLSIAGKTLAKKNKLAGNKPAASNSKKRPAK